MNLDFDFFISAHAPSAPNLSQENFEMERSFSFLSFVVEEKAIIP